jgi:hypothetical protein
MNLYTHKHEKKPYPHHIEPGILVDRTHCRTGVGGGSLHNLPRMRDIVLKFIKLF